MELKLVRIYANPRSFFIQYGIGWIHFIMRQPAFDFMD